jgi:hypothetical protein
MSPKCGRLLCNNNMKPHWYKYTKGTTVTSDHISIRMTYDANMTSDYISATTTYVMCRKEHVVMSVYSEEYTFTVLFCLLIPSNTHPQATTNRLMLQVIQQSRSLRYCTWRRKQIQSRNLVFLRNNRRWTKSKSMVLSVQYTIVRTLQNWPATMSTKRVDETITVAEDSARKHATTRTAPVDMKILKV